MKKTRILSYLLLGVSVVFISACGGGGDSEAGPNTVNTKKYHVEISLSSVMALQEGVYMLWAELIDGGYQKIGTFSEGGQIEFDFDSDIEQIGQILVTIEWERDADTSFPSQIEYLSGELQSDGSVDLGFPVSFEGAHGEFMAYNYSSTPLLSVKVVKGETPIIERGVWFAHCAGPVLLVGNIDPQSIGDDIPAHCYMQGDLDTVLWYYDPIPGLSLPSLPRGWEYEAWVKTDDGRTFSMGHFRSANGPDSSNQYLNIYSSFYKEVILPAQASPFDFPGEEFTAEEFFSEPVNVLTSEVFITVEPNAANFDDPTGVFRPFSTKILALKNPVSGVGNVLERKLENVPSGFGQITEVVDESLS